MKNITILLLLAISLIFASGCSTVNSPDINVNSNKSIDRGHINNSLTDEVLFSEKIQKKAEDLLRNGSYNEAFQMYQTEILKNSTDPKIWFNYGVALMEAKEYPDAVESFEKAEKFGLANKNPYWYNKGIVNIGIGHYEEANEYFKMIDSSDLLYPKGIVLSGITRKFSKHGDGIEQMVISEKFDDTKQISLDNIELFNLGGDVGLTIPSFVKEETLILPKEKNEKIIKELQDLVEEYFNKHEYSKEDLFVCTDMALDLWNQLKTKNIPANIVVGCLEKRYPAEEDFNHAWVVAGPISGKYVAMDPTSGEVILDNERYYNGFYFDNPKNLKEYTGSLDDYKSQANVVYRIVNRYDERWEEYSSKLSILNNDVDTYNRRFAGRSLSSADQRLATSLDSDIETMRIIIDTMEDELESLEKQVVTERYVLKEISNKIKSLPISINTANRKVLTPEPAIME